MKQIVVNLIVTDEMFDKLLPVLASLGSTHVEEDIRLSDAARMYGWHRTSLWRWAKAGQIPYTQVTARGDMFFKASDLVAFNEKRKNQKRGRGEVSDGSIDISKLRNSRGKKPKMII